MLLGYSVTVAILHAIWLSQIPPLPKEGGNQGNTLMDA